MNTEEIILVNEQDEPVGTMEKMEVHRKGVLHRAFSVFVFNTKGELLLQQRALNKYHSGGLWTNTCCSHPRPGEATIDAANRRLQEEMGFTTSLTKVFDFTYKKEFDNGLTEFEFDHVFTGIYENTIVSNTDEVHDYCYKSMQDIKESLASHPAKYTAWFHIAFPLIEKWLQENMINEIA